MWITLWIKICFVNRKSIILNKNSSVMLYSHTQESDKLNSILLFLNFTIDGEAKYKSYINDIIEEAVELFNHRKTIYEISKENFFIIVSLQELGRDFLGSLDIENLTQEDYIAVKRSLEEASHLVA